MGDGDRSYTLLELLAWYGEMGVDEAVAARPTAWLGRGDRAPGEAAQASPRHRQAAPSPVVAAAPPGMAAPLAERRFPATVPDAAVMAARAAARQAASLEELATRLTGFEGCTLKATAKNLCFYRGQARSALMLIGEAPGREEDLEGKPFVGRAGQLREVAIAGRSVRAIATLHPAYLLRTPAAKRLAWRDLLLIRAALGAAGAEGGG